MSVFSEKDLILLPSSPVTPYERRKGQHTTLHWGQLKLFLGELNFFLQVWNPTEIPSPLVVYVGAAPGYHTDLMTEFFPNLRFDLYDKSDFGIKPSNNVRIFNEYFDDEKAKQYAAMGEKIFFISDIRRGIAATEAEEEQIENEEVVEQDMDSQARWVKIIKPEFSLLKFRLPWIINKDSAKTKVYLDGKVFFQPFAGWTSTETRILVSKSDEFREIEWDNKKYEGQLFHHNNITRENNLLYKTILTPYSGVGPKEDEDYLDQRYDSAGFLYLLEVFVQKIGFTLKNEAEKREVIKSLARYTIQRVGRGGSVTLRTIVETGGTLGKLKTKKK